MVMPAMTNVGDDFAVHAPDIGYDEVTDAIAERHDRVDARATAVEPAQPPRLVEVRDRKAVSDENVCLRHVLIERSRILSCQDTNMWEALLHERGMIISADGIEQNCDNIINRRHGG